MENYNAKNLKELEEIEGDIATRMFARTDAAEAAEKALTKDELDADTADGEMLVVVRSAIETKKRAASNKALIGNTRSNVYVPATSFAVPKAELSLNDELVVYRSWMLAQKNKASDGRHTITDRQRNLAERAGCDLDKNEFVLRSQTVGTANTGGNGVNGAIVIGFEKAQKHSGFVSNEVRHLSLGNGGPVKYLYNDNTGNRAAYVAELGDLSGTTRNITKIDFPEAPKIGSGTYDISSELLEDAAFDVLGWTNDTILDSLARKANYEATLGDNDTGHTQGIVPFATAVRTAAPTAFTLADWKKLKFSVDYAYRNTSECVIQCHDQMVYVLELMVDENGRPLWQPDYVNGTPGRFDGFRISINNDMAYALTADTKVMVFGNMQKFAWRDVGGPRIKSEFNLKTDSVDFAGYLRFDTRGLNAQAIKVLQMAAS